MIIDIQTPSWSRPIFEKQWRYIGLKGGRSGGKSHFLAERIIEEMIVDPHLSVVCIREIQKSLKFSAKKLLEAKIEKLGVSRFFRITANEIRRRCGTGVCIFQGMQDHTADSIKSLEDFRIAWVEEAQNISRRSLQLLLPTIRGGGSEIWFSWNPDQPTDPINKHFEHWQAEQDMICIHVNYLDNAFCSPEILREVERHRRVDPETFGHIWLGDFNTKSDDQVLAGKYCIEEFDINKTFGNPYFGVDWGFAVDPTVIVKVYIKDNTLYVAQESYAIHCEIIDTPILFGHIKDAKNHVIRADSARPELISYMKRHGYPKIQAVDKWPGSVEDGISALRSFDRIVIHPGCRHAAEEARLWKYKRDRLTGDVLPELIDRNNHCCDAIRYSISPLIKHRSNINDLLDLAIR